PRPRRTAHANGGRPVESRDLEILRRGPAALLERGPFTTSMSDFRICSKDRVLFRRSRRRGSLIRASAAKVRLWRSPIGFPPPLPPSRLAARRFHRTWCSNSPTRRDRWL